MVVNNIVKVLPISSSKAVRINPVFYQLLSKPYRPWFYERFINLVSYKKHGQHIVDFVDNNSNVYATCINTLHVYGVDELTAENFREFIINAVLNEQFVNLWCDEYYIKASIRYGKNHFVHPLTIYGIKKDQVCCEFFSINRGMMLTEIPICDLQLAFYSIKEHYTQGASYDILKRAISSYEIKTPDIESFSLTNIVQELRCYWHSQPNSMKRYECSLGNNNVTYGIAYYNELFSLLRDDECYSSFPYKGLFDLHLHKLLWVERLEYIKEHCCFDRIFDVHISAAKNIAQIYENINLLNIKNNRENNISPYMLSQNTDFKENFIRLLERAYEMELEAIPKLISFLSGHLNDQYMNHLDEFNIVLLGNDMVLYPLFDDYVQQICIQIASQVNNEIPVQMQLSNGYCFFPDTSSKVNSYTIRPVKLDWIRITNCQSIKLLYINKLYDKTETVLDKCSILYWHPMNHIDNWQFHNSVVKFDICGIDPYLICENTNIDAIKYPYITIIYSTNDISSKAQLFFMTNVSTKYTPEKMITYNIVNNNEKYSYKLDLSECPSWNNIVTMLRVDPVHYSAMYDSQHIRSQCVIYGIKISSVPIIYASTEDFSGIQNANQWEYCCYINGKKVLLEYDCTEKIWKNNYGAYMGAECQGSNQGIEISRNWECPSKGKYMVHCSGSSTLNTVFTIIVNEGKMIYKTCHGENLNFEEELLLQKDESLRFVSEGGRIEKLSIKIQKKQPKC